MVWVRFDHFGMACRFSLICLLCKAGIILNQFWFRTGPILLPAGSCSRVIFNSVVTGSFVIMFLPLICDLHSFTANPTLMVTCQ
jgi:hypothetical protein